MVRRAPRKSNPQAGSHRCIAGSIASATKRPHARRAWRVASSPGMVRHSMMNSQRSGMMLRMVPPWIRADMDRGVRRIEAVLERAFPRQCGALRPRHRRSPRRRPWIALTPLRGLAGMPGQAAHRARAGSACPCARGSAACRTARRRRTTRASSRIRRGPGRSRLGAVAADLLVVADEQVQRPGEVRALKSGTAARQAATKPFMSAAPRAISRPPSRRSVNGSAVHA